MSMADEHPLHICELCQGVGYLLHEAYQEACPACGPGDDDDEDEAEYGVDDDGNEGPLMAP